MPSSTLSSTLLSDGGGAINVVVAVNNVVDEVVRKIFSIDGLVIDAFEEDGVDKKEEVVGNIVTVPELFIIADAAVYIFFVDSVDNDVLVDSGIVVQDLSVGGAEKGFLRE
ncbi:hypothetical protein NDU88_001674 [Pleurodeles waltl]|uniref:Uncharacterized protein n=1 Tax=Pleurodeles waltl TaxID=8319 RepID=A0AAV7UB31_PLEWA|nr:hypothetical protein NDU88_001674 [Pleurodeles waltl]